MKHSWSYPCLSAFIGGPMFFVGGSGSALSIGALPHLLELVDDVGGVLELRRAGKGLFEDYVGDAGGGVWRQGGGREVADLPAAKPPLLAEILEVVDLAAAFPIDVDGA